MQKSTGTLRSQNPLLATNNNRTVRQQRTATSNRTGGLSSSAQTSSAHKVVEKQKPRIIDESNVDVTPKPLFDQEVTTKTRHGSALFHSIEGTSTPTDMLSSGSILNTNAILTAAQSFGAFAENSTHVSSDSNQVPSDSIQEYGGAGADKEVSALFYINVEKQAKKDTKTHTVNLSETQTFFLLDFPAICVSNEDPGIESVKQQNQKYVELCKNKSGNDSYADRGINTFNDLPKIKSTQTDRLTINEKGVMCTAWDMYDSFNNQENNTDPDDLNNLATKNDQAKNSTIFDEQSEHKIKSSHSEAGTTVVSESTAPGQHSAVVEVKKVKENKLGYLEDQNFKLNLFYMERLINLNSYQNKQARYRNLKPLNLLDEALKDQNSKIPLQQYDGLSLEKLWTYSCGLTKDRNLSCIIWNKKNKDILAAGYGKFEFNDDPSGLVCCWSLKNPEFPERYYKTDAGVTSLAFSNKHSNLLAVGLFNGNILVFDVRNNNTAPLLSTNESENKHLSPVWNLKWTDKDRASSNGESDEMEVLMSISSDGRVTQWMIRKGFESSDYLKLKRVSSKSTQNKKEKEKSDGLISRHSGGLCFDIWDQDKSIYLCGTEEGFIHRCSTSYNEQYLDTYYGHTGPVYKLAWSPFLKNCFVSASADWTIRLWKINRQSPCLTFNNTSSKSVFDICWSNHSATLFCCVNENSIELWDLSKSTLEPIYSTTPHGSTKLTSISYSPNSDSLVVGTNDGNLYIYGIKNLPMPTKENDLEDIIKQSLISQLETLKVDDEETKEMIERHQLESMNSADKKQDEIDEERKDKLDAFEAKLDKIKSENEAILQGKLVHKNKKNKSKGSKTNNEDSSSDEEKPKH